MSGPISSSRPGQHHVHRMYEFVGPPQGAVEPRQRGARSRAGPSGIDVFCDVRMYTRRGACHPRASCRQEKEQRCPPTGAWQGVLRVWAG